MKVGDIVYSVTTATKLKIIAFYEDEGKEMAIVTSVGSIYSTDDRHIYPVSRLTMEPCPALKDDTKIRGFLSGLKKLEGDEIKDLLIHWNSPNVRPVRINIEFNLLEKATKSMRSDE